MSLPNRMPFNHYHRSLCNPAGHSARVAFVASLTLIGLLALSWTAGVAVADDVMSEAVSDSDPPPEESAEKECPESEEKAVLGATAEFMEMESGFVYTARVDTGATTCSIHATQVEVDGGKKSMLKNIGKEISFELESPDGKKKQRVTTTIADTVRVKTSNDDKIERRYKVWLTLKQGDIKRRVHVTLNDRSHMEYPLLIGRNYLCGQFVVDVSQELTPLKVADDEQPQQEGTGG